MTIWCRTALVALLILGASPAGPSAQTDSEVDPFARYLLRSMSRTLESVPALSFEVESTIDVVDQVGLMVQASENVQLALRRPDRLMVRFNTEGHRRGFTYDGKTATIYHMDYEVYSTTDVPATIDQALAHLDEEFGFSVPVNEFVSTSPYEWLMAGVTEGTYLGLAEIDGISCHHLVFRESEIDWQIWIEDTAWMFPRKLVVTYKRLEGWPQYTARFSEWNQRATLPDAIFEFHAPEIAKKIRFLELSSE